MGNFTKSKKPLVKLKGLRGEKMVTQGELADVLGISISGVKRLAERGMLSASPGCDIMKYRIREARAMYGLPNSMRRVHQSRLLLAAALPLRIHSIQIMPGSPGRL